MHLPVVGSDSNPPRLSWGSSGGLATKLAAPLANPSVRSLAVACEPNDPHDKRGGCPPTTRRRAGERSVARPARVAQPSWLWFSSGNRTSTTRMVVLRAHWLMNSPPRVFCPFCPGSDLSNRLISCDLRPGRSQILVHNALLYRKNRVMQSNANFVVGNNWKSKQAPWAGLFPVGLFVKLL